MPSPSSTGAGRPGCQKMASAFFWGSDKQFDLIHRIQRERGATCAWIASGGAQCTPCSCGTGSLVADLRRRTDTVLGTETLPELDKLRAVADSLFRDDRAPATSPSRRSKVFYATHRGYTQLIGGLLNKLFECIPPNALTELTELR